MFSALYEHSRHVQPTAHRLLIPALLTIAPGPQLLSSIDYSNGSASRRITNHPPRVARSRASRGIIPTERTSLQRVLQLYCTGAISTIPTPV